MLNAYYDDRSYLKDLNQSSIRIMTVQIRNVTEANLFCQIWFEGITDPIISEVHEYQQLWFKDALVNSTNLLPVFITCMNPLFKLVPLSVSVVASPCDVPSNNLKVIHNLPEDGEQKTVAVCSKLFDYKDDSSMILIEWIEILLILGVEKIAISVVYVHPNMMKVLKFYETTGKVKIEQFAFPNASTGLFFDDMIAINDCFYKHMNEFKFIVATDIDELLLPSHTEDQTWHDLLQRILPKSFVAFPSYEVQSVFFNLDNDHQGEFQPEVPSNFLFLQHIYRAKRFATWSSGAKSFMRTEKVIVAHNHRAMHCVSRCLIFYIAPEDAKLHHYRNGCGGGYDPGYCDDYKSHTMKDTTLWKYKDKIIENVLKTIETSGIVKIE